MKKLVIASISIILSLQFSFAQLESAKIAFDGLEYAQAKTSIDKYMLKEKALTDPRGWLMKGKIYQSINFSEKPEIKSLLTEDATKTIIEAYNKTIELDKSKSQDFAKQAKEQLDMLYASTFNEGIKLYQADDFKGAIEKMNLSKVLKPNDTLAYFVGSQLSMQVKDYAASKADYYKLIDLGSKNYQYYRNLLYITLEEEKNNEEAYKVIQMGRQQFPNDATFMAQEVNYYITAGKTKEAIEKLELAVTKDAANAKVYYYNLGIIYKQTKEDAKAKDYFAKSLALDPDYEESNYMTGLIFLEEGDMVNKKVNNMNIKEYNTLGKKEEAKRDELYKKSIPYLEKSYNKSKDQKVKEQLVYLYKKFKMDDKISTLK